MDATKRQRIETLAKADAVLFAEEFPGQQITGDWDSQAWESAPRELRDADEAWDVYREALHAEVSRLRGHPLNRIGRPSSDAEMMADAEAARAEREYYRNGGLP